MRDIKDILDHWRPFADNLLTAYINFSLLKYISKSNNNSTATNIDPWLEIILRDHLIIQIYAIVIDTASDRKKYSLSLKNLANDYTVNGTIPDLNPIYVDMSDSLESLKLIRNKMIAHVDFRDSSVSKYFAEANKKLTIDFFDELFSKIFNILEKVIGKDFCIAIIKSADKIVEVEGNKTKL